MNDLGGPLPGPMPPENWLLAWFEQRIGRTEDNISRSLDKLATKDQVIELDKRLGDMDKRVDTLEKSELARASDEKHITRSRQSRTQWFQWIPMAVATIVLASVTLYVALK